jgi:hypothetical protein
VVLGGRLRLLPARDRSLAHQQQVPPLWGRLPLLLLHRHPFQQGEVPEVQDGAGMTTGWSRGLSPPSQNFIKPGFFSSAVGHVLIGGRRDPATAGLHRDAQRTGSDLRVGEEGLRRSAGLVLEGGGLLRGGRQEDRGAEAKGRSPAGTSRKRFPRTTRPPFCPRTRRAS